MSDEQMTSDRSEELGRLIQAAIEQAGFTDYQLETLEMVKRDDKALRGFPPNCRVECKVSGFPPKVKCKLVCG